MPDTIDMFLVVDDIMKEFLLVFQILLPQRPWSDCIGTWKFFFGIQIKHVHNCVLRFWSSSVVLCFARLHRLVGFLFEMYLQQFQGQTGTDSEDTQDASVLAATRRTAASSAKYRSVVVRRTHSEWNLFPRSSVQQTETQRGIMQFIQSVIRYRPLYTNLV